MFKPFFRNAFYSTDRDCNCCFDPARLTEVDVARWLHRYANWQAEIFDILATHRPDLLDFARRHAAKLEGFHALCDSLGVVYAA